MHGDNSNDGDDVMGTLLIFSTLIFCEQPDFAVIRLSLDSRVESGSDDLDDVGHLGNFFDGSGGFHLQTKLSGCDLDFYMFIRIIMMLASGKRVDLGYICHAKSGPPLFSSAWSKYIKIFGPPDNLFQIC